jgi:hypothetical protein
MEAEKNRVGVSGNEGEREREKQIRGVRDRAQERIRNGVCWEMTVGKDIFVFQISRKIKCQSRRI